MIDFRSITLYKSTSGEKFQRLGEGKRRKENQKVVFLIIGINGGYKLDCFALWYKHIKLMLSILELRAVANLGTSNILVYVEACFVMVFFFFSVMRNHIVVLI